MPRHILRNLGFGGEPAQAALLFQQTAAWAVTGSNTLCKRGYEPSFGAVKCGLWSQLVRG